MKKPTLTDVAQSAGVSYATADRVVNNRGRVRDATVQKVETAVAALGYVRNVAAANLAQSRSYTFEFILPDNGNPFFDTMRALLAARAALLRTDRIEIRVTPVPAFDPAALAQALAHSAHAKIDGLAVVGLDSTDVTAPLEALRANGTPVVSLVSDLPFALRDTYIGIDNTQAGRTAARLMGLAHGGAAGHVQVIAGDLSARDHHDRLDGFRAVLSAHFPQITIGTPIETLDDQDRVAQAVRDSLASPQTVSGLYALGAAVTGLYRAVPTRGPRPLVVAHELLPESRAALTAGQFDMVLDQRPETEIDAALAHLRALADRVPPPERAPLSPMIYLADNMPPPDTDQRPLP